MKLDVSPDNKAFVFDPLPPIEGDKGVSLRLPPLMYRPGSVRTASALRLSATGTAGTISELSVRRDKCTAGCQRIFPPAERAGLDA